jgi:hypothetical protein
VRRRDGERSGVLREHLLRPQLSTDLHIPVKKPPKTGKDDLKEYKEQPLALTGW